MQERVHPAGICSDFPVLDPWGDSAPGRGWSELLLSRGSLPGLPRMSCNTTEVGWGREWVVLIPTAPEVWLLPSEYSQFAPLEVLCALAAEQWRVGYLQGRNVRVWAQFSQFCLVLYCETAFSERRCEATASLCVLSELPSTQIIFSGMARNVLCEKEKWR